MIIDAHAHIDEVLALGWVDPPEKAVSLMDGAGIDRAVVSTYSNLPGINPKAMEYVADAVARYPTRFIPYIRLDPWYGDGAIAVLRRAVLEHGFKGVKLHPPHYTLHPHGEQTVAILREAGRLGVPVLFHCADEVMSLPLQVGEGARQAPDTTVILGHMGGFFHTADAFTVAERYPNLMLDTCEMPYPRAIREATERIGPDRVLFGTDLPTDNPTLEVEKVRLAGLSPEVEEKVFWSNIARVLRLSDVGGTGS